MSPRSNSKKTQSRRSTSRAPKLPVANRSKTGRDSLSPDEGSPLRLSVAGGSLGLETYRPVSLGAIRVESICWSLPSLKFPIDLSGGVASFRHRRGQLRKLVVTGQQLELEQALSHRVRSVHKAVHKPIPGGNRGSVSLWALDQGIGVGVSGAGEALAFDMHWVPTGSSARLVISNARTSGADKVPLGQALRLSDTLFGKFSERRGRVVTIASVATQLSQLLAPLLGTRAPAASAANVSVLESQEASWQVTLDSSEPSPALALRGIQALELAHLCSDADDQLAGGDLEAARSGYTQALERAPQHPELVRLVAEIDAATGEVRGEAALGMLVDCLPASQFGAVGATLLARTGDLTGAVLAAEHAASLEVYAPVAAELWARLAEISPSAEEQSRALNRAIAASPGLATVRWARFEARAQWQDETGAVADAEHLEAAARGANARHEVLLRCGTKLVDVGLVKSAGRIFERALRYLPDDPEANFGLALSLLQTRKRKRALTLLERAVELSEKRGSLLIGAVIELAQQLAEQAGDHPQAIARIAQVPASQPRLFLRAKALEGRWRAAVGDLKGASLAFSQLREQCERETDKPSIRHAAAWLSEAAEFEKTQMGEIGIAEQHLAEAIRLAPRNRRLRGEYRLVAALVLQRSQPE